MRMTTEEILQQILAVMERIDKKLEKPHFDLMHKLEQIQNQIGTQKFPS